jgi:formate dehydrogenase major subunit
MPACSQFEALWGVTPIRGWGHRRRNHERVHAGTIRGMYIMGENPAMSADVQHARQALSELEMLVQTSSHGDGWSRRDHRHRRLGRRSARSPIPIVARATGREALALPVCAPRSRHHHRTARELGLDWHYAHPRDVFEMRL